MALTLLSPAKLNLFLHITGRRADGYHELQTLFQLLDWGDEMHFEVNDSGNIRVDMGASPPIPLQDNLIWRAATLLQRGGQGVDIRVHKRIPAGGGLGGGSSNAATTLLALNALWGCDLERAELRRLGLKMGADVPVFVGGHSAWAEGVGEHLQAVELPPRWYLVITPDAAISTGEIFSHPRLTRDTSPITIAAFFEGTSRNDCQPIAEALYPEVAKALNWLGNFAESRLTGTGASLFASFPSKAEAEAIATQVPAQWQAVVARGINRSPVLDALALT